MNDLFVIEKRDFAASQTETVNARDLHAFLEVGKDFSNWIKDRIEQYSFAEGTDYVVFAEIGGNPLLAESGEQKGRGGHNRKEYALTLDTAKELAMIQNNEQGRRARAYFIECERRAKTAVQIDLHNPKQLRTLAVQLIEVNEELQAKITAMAPDVAALERIAKSDGSLCVTDAAKTLQVKPKGLFQYLRAHRWIYQRVGNTHYCGYEARIQAGDLEHKTVVVLKADGEEKTTTQVRVTPKGLAKLAKLMGPTLQVAA